VNTHASAPIDANGNLTSDGTRSYFWNALNQLVEVKEGSTTIVWFTEIAAAFQHESPSD
jgi:hypothetical protein